MGVQVGVAIAAVAVRERRGHEAARLDLTQPVLASAGERRVLLDPLQRVRDRIVVDLL